jgi:hypothetical protein
MKGSTRWPSEERTRSLQEVVFRGVDVVVEVQWSNNLKRVYLITPEKHENAAEVLLQRCPLLPAKDFSAANPDEGSFVFHYAGDNLAEAMRVWIERAEEKNFRVTYRSDPDDLAHEVEDELDYVGLAVKYPSRQAS